ncbi:MAG: hypothetical protein F8N36_15920 [Desulfovibrio sp.]|uniref:hypothetical protein n=1 Tax=Desulfovibrio sp. TaxID=885 RepID=UPI00135E1763|nr:hypothetical protein [Desulfovibrio sp.]MTJ94326.1 hypothetical protein [Desulfovibrio sp.]
MAYIFRNHEILAILQVTETLVSDADLMAIANVMAAAHDLQAAALFAQGVLAQVGTPTAGEAVNRLSAALAAAAGKQAPAPADIPSLPVTVKADPHLDEMVQRLRDLLEDILDWARLPDRLANRVRAELHGDGG